MVKNTKPKTTKKNTYTALDKRVKKLESNVKAEETKKLYLSQQETLLISTSPTLTLLNVINSLNQGDNASTIDGISYSLRGIAMKFLVHNTSANPAIVRLAVIRASSGFTMSTAGESLLTGAQQNGLDFSSASEYQRYYCPINRKKYDVVMERTFKIGAKNSTYTSNMDCNKLVRGYKKYQNKKEFLNSQGNPDTKYYIVGWCVDTNMDFNTINVEVTGETCFYYKDN